MVGLVLSCIEDQRYIQMNKSSAASCYWHSAFAHACALAGYGIVEKYPKWRQQCESVLGQCGAGTVYQECPHSCLNSCSDKDPDQERGLVCRQQCLAGKFTYSCCNSGKSLFLLFRLHL